MERTPLTYQWLEESGEVDMELLALLEAHRIKDSENPPFFFEGVRDYTLTETQVLLLRM